jgi:hypothetical protein
LAENEIYLFSFSCDLLLEIDLQLGFVLEPAHSTELVDWVGRNSTAAWGWVSRWHS